MAEQDIIERLGALLGPDRVDASNAAREIAAGDFFRTTQPPACVVRPRDKHEVASVVACAAEAGYAVHPRGGGMSFSGGYAPRSPRSITLDLSAMNEVLEINEQDLYVIVQPGCSWLKLYETLRAKGLRVPAFGTRSGRQATVGGSLSQTGMMLGSSRYGMTIEQVLGLEVVLGDGSLVRTGHWAFGPGKPYFRFGAPDLTGPFLGDFGAMGVKVEIALRLMEWPAHEGTASFAFDTFDSLHQAETTIQRLGLAAEMIAFDDNLQRLTMDGIGLREDARVLAGLVREKGLVGGVVSAVKFAVAGKGFMAGSAYTLHIVTEARHKAAVDASLAEIRQIAKSAGGREIADTVAQMIRIDPYPHMDQVLGARGERWVPMPFAVPASQGLAAMKRIDEVLARHAEIMGRLGIEVGLLVGSYAPVLFNLDLMIYWPDRPTPLHRATASKEKVAQGDSFADNPEARAFLSDLWSELMDATAEFGANYIGIAGPDLRFPENRDPGNVALLQGFKHAVDPACTLSPGAFGLTPSSSGASPG